MSKEVKNIDRKKENVKKYNKRQMQYLLVLRSRGTYNSQQIHNAQYEQKT